MKFTYSLLRMKKIILLMFLFIGLLVSCGETNSTNNNGGNTTSQSTPTYREIIIKKGDDLESYLDVDIDFIYDSLKGRYDEAVIQISSFNGTYRYINAYVVVFFNGITQTGTTKISEYGKSQFTVTCSKTNISQSMLFTTITANSNFTIRVPK